MSSNMWPDGQEAKTLLCLRVHCKAEDLFRTLWEQPDLNVQLHKIRNDSNFRETPWVNSLEELPRTDQPLELLPPRPGQPGAVAPNRWHKSRFDSPPMAMATKPFQNEELHHCIELIPGQRYKMELKANTTAPYGDKFDLFFRHLIVAENKMTTNLHIEFTLVWLPSMNRMMKAVIHRAIEGGVYGAHKTFREVLETFHIVEDMDPKELKDIELTVPQALPPAAPAAAAIAAAQPAVVAPSIPAAAHAAAPAVATDAVSAKFPNSLAIVADHGRGVFTHFFGSLVWNDQVDSISEVVGGGRRVAGQPRESPGARMLASLVTLSLVHTVVGLLQSAQAACANRSGIIWFVCLPLTHVVDVPDSLFEVMSALLLVAAINYVVIYASKLSLNAGQRMTAASSASEHILGSLSRTCTSALDPLGATAKEATAAAPGAHSAEGNSPAPALAEVAAMADPVTAAAASAATTSTTKPDPKEQTARTAQPGGGPGSAGATMKGSGAVVDSSIAASLRQGGGGAVSRSSSASGGGAAKKPKASSSSSSKAREGSSTGGAGSKGASKTGAVQAKSQAGQQQGSSGDASSKRGGATNKAPSTHQPPSAARTTAPTSAGPPAPAAPPSQPAPLKPTASGSPPQQQQQEQQPSGRVSISSGSNAGPPVMEMSVLGASARKLDEQADTPTPEPPPAASSGTRSAAPAPQPPPSPASTPTEPTDPTKAPGGASSWGFSGGWLQRSSGSTSASPSHHPMSPSQAKGGSPTTSQCRASTFDAAAAAAPAPAAPSAAAASIPAPTQPPQQQQPSQQQLPSTAQPPQEQQQQQYTTVSAGVPAGPIPSTSTPPGSPTSQTACGNLPHPTAPSSTGNVPQVHTQQQQGTSHACPPGEPPPPTSGALIVASQPAAAAAALAAAAAAADSPVPHPAPISNISSASHSSNANRALVPAAKGTGGWASGTSSGATSTGSTFVAGAQYPPGALLPGYDLSWMKGNFNLDNVSEGLKGLSAWHKSGTGLNVADAEAIAASSLMGGGMLEGSNSSSATGMARALGYTGPSLDANPNAPINGHSFAQNTGPLAPHFEQRLLLVQALAEKAKAQSRDVTSDVVVEEVFENERFQPFRGWGHNWPGHFLPTDRVGHWSDRYGKPGGYASMDFAQVEPTLPAGYSWEEDVWRIDFEGAEPSIKAVDENGWTYAVDFNYLEYPFSVGGGIVRMNQFVRRRRWTRTRLKNSALKHLCPDEQTSESCQEHASVSEQGDGEEREEAHSHSESEHEESVGAKEDDGEQGEGQEQGEQEEEGEEGGDEREGACSGSSVAEGASEGEGMEQQEMELQELPSGSSSREQQQQQQEEGWACDVEQHPAGAEQVQQQQQSQYQQQQQPVLRHNQPHNGLDSQQQGQDKHAASNAEHPALHTQRTGNTESTRQNSSPHRPMPSPPAPQADLPHHERSALVPQTIGSHASQAGDSIHQELHPLSPNAPSASHPTPTPPPATSTPVDSNSSGSSTAALPSHPVSTPPLPPHPPLAHTSWGGAPAPPPPPPPPPPQADVASTGGMPSWIVAPPRVHAAACASPQYPASPDGVGTTTSTSVHGASSNQAPPHSPPASSHGCLPQPPASQPPTTTLAPESAFPQASNALPVSNGAAQHMQSTPAPLPHHQSPAQYTPNQPLEAQRSHAGGHLPLGGIGSSQPHPAGSSFSELNKMAAVTTAAPSAALMHQQQVQMHPQPPVLPPPAVQQLPVQHPPAQSHPPPMVGALPAQGQHQNQAPPMNTNDDDQDSVLLLVPDGPKGDQQDEQGHQKLQQQVAGSAQQPLTEEEDGNLAEWGWG